MTSTATAARGTLDTLDVALYAFCLLPPNPEESDTALLYRDLMAARTSREGLRRSADREAIFAAQRLRLALQLAPLEAIAYSDSNPKARWKLVQSHLLDQFTGASSEIVTQLARRIATTLADWQEPRNARSPYERAVWKKSDGKCSACKYDFEAEVSPALASLDPFKPYYLSPVELTSPEIDHIVAVSGIGTNDVNNLQLLCRWCNFGKGDGLGVDIRMEALHAATPIAEIARQHRANMFYMTLADSAFLCEHCAGRKELTVRLHDTRHGFLLSNLMTICYGCIESQNNCATAPQESSAC